MFVPGNSLVSVSMAEEPTVCTFANIHTYHSALKTHNNYKSNLTNMGYGDLRIAFLSLPLPVSFPQQSFKDIAVAEVFLAHTPVVLLCYSPYQVQWILNI